MNKQPRILIVARGVWDDSKGTSSTLTNLFAHYDPDRLAMIYVESKHPKTKCCHTFFQIPEIQMAKNFFRLGIKVGQKVEAYAVEENDIKSEENVLGFVRGHRFLIFSWLRELLWLFGGWRSKALEEFVAEFNPDIVWLDGSTNIFLDRLYSHVLKVANKPGIIYLMDDNYTWKSLTGYRYLYHFLHRKTMYKVVTTCKKVLVISPKMKKEFDELFHVDSTIITKGIDYSKILFKRMIPHTPVRLLYMGQIIYGRDYTLSILLQELAKINEKEVKIEFSIYTTNIVPARLTKLIESCNGAKLCCAVPYSEVQRVINDNDVLVFMESLSLKYSRDARLSFSTKITDYLTSGKCIFAIGPEDSAPMEYFQEEECAIIAHNRASIQKGIRIIIDNHVIGNYGEKAFQTGKKNHDKKVMDERLNKVLKELLK